MGGCIAAADGAKLGGQTLAEIVALTPAQLVALGLSEVSPVVHLHSTTERRRSHNSKCCCIYLFTGFYPCCCDRWHRSTGWFLAVHITAHEALGRDLRHHYPFSYSVCNVAGFGQ